MLISRWIALGRTVPAPIVPVSPEVDDTLFVHQPTLSKINNFAAMWTHSLLRRLFARFDGLAVRQLCSFHYPPTSMTGISTSSVTPFVMTWIAVSLMNNKVPSAAVIRADIVYRGLAMSLGS